MEFCQLFHLQGPGLGKLAEAMVAAMVAGTGKLPSGKLT